MNTVKRQTSDYTSCFNTFPKSIPFVKTPLKISPSLLILSIAFLIVKSFILSPFFTSSQCNGMETVAPGFGLGNRVRQALLWDGSVKNRHTIFLSCFLQFVQHW